MTNRFYDSFLYKLFIGIVIVSMALPTSLVSAASLANPPATEAAQAEENPDNLAITPQVFDSPILEPEPLRPGSSNGRISEEGGRLASPDGRVTVEFPEAATKDTLDLVLTTALPAEEQQPERKIQQRQEQQQKQIWMLITLKPAGLRTSNAQTSLAQEINLSVDLSGYPTWQEPRLLRRDSKSQDAWEEVPTTFNPETQLLSAKVEGLGEYAVAAMRSSNTESEFPDTGTHYLMTNLPDVSTFSGAATYNYNLDLPGGRNGLAPALSLSYNSNGLNAMLGVVQSGNVGLGWSMGGTSSIVRKIKSRHSVNCFYDPGDPDRCAVTWEYANEFTLMLGGTGYDLTGPEKIGTSGGCRYYAEDAPQLLVMRYTAGSGSSRCGYDGLDTPPTWQNSKEYWIVTTPEGTEYRMGFNDNSEQFARLDGYTPNGTTLATYAGQDTTGVAYRWSVDLVKDVYDNTITYGYVEEYYPAFPGNINHDRAQHLDWIRYTGRASDTDSGPYLVDVVLENRTNQNDNGGGARFDAGLDGEENLYIWKPWSMWDSLRVDKVRVCVSPNGGKTCPTNGNLMEYDLDYQFTTEDNPGWPIIVGDKLHQTTRLTSITKSGWDATGAKKSLPATTFGYGPSRMAAAAHPVEYPRLETVTNGYGGSVQFVYGNHQYSFDGRTIYNLYVAQKQVSDGLGHTSTVQYGYHTPCFSGGSSDCSKPGDGDDSGALIGHARTTVQVFDYDGSTPLAYNESKFYTEQGILQGKSYESAVYNADGSGTPQQKSTTTWGTRAFYGDTEFAYVAQSQSVDLSGTDKVSTRSDFTYDGFNNTVAEYHYGAEALLVNPGFERQTEGWTVDGGLLSDEHAFAGFYSYKLKGGQLDNQVAVAETQVDNLTVGESYKIEMWAHRNSVSQGQVQICSKTPSASDWGCSGLRTPTSVAGKWTRLERTVTASTSSLMIRVKHSGAAGGVFVDQLSVAKVSDSNDERSVQRFFHNTNDPDKWFIGLPYGENLIEGIATNAMVAGTDAIKSKTRMYYDGSTSLTAPNLTHGRVTKQYQGDPLIRQVSYQYDSYGNVFRQTDANGTITSNNYDAAYHQFPIQSYVTVNGNTQYYKTEYYGVQNVTAGGGYFGLFGQVKRTYGPNNDDTATSYSYDALGRQRLVVQPDDSITHPTSEIRYFDGVEHKRTNTGPFMIRQMSRGEQGVNWSSDPDGVATWSRTFYDGLGRPVQAHAPHTNWTPGGASGQEVIVYTEYDALGRSIKQSVPELKTQWQWATTVVNGETRLVTPYHQPSTLTNVGSSTLYDTLGRPSQAIAPDGTRTKSYYNGLQTAVIDAEEHMRITESDSFGQVIKVKEYGGTFSNVNWTITPNSTTSYSYDLLGNLTKVLNSADSLNPILISYDSLGRKTSMNDPDMGEWFYGYDNNGNLTSQTDARGCVSNFEYDELNRMESKSYSANCPGSNPNVTYTYDQTGTAYGQGIGQRTSMTNGSSTTTWRYDTRGRVTRAKYIIAGTTYNYYTSYDSANRPVSVTYPDGEIVTTSYAMGGSPDGLSSNQRGVLVKDVAYNQRGQLNTLTYGNNVITNYTYDESGHSYRLKGLLASKGSTNWLNLTYQYDNVGNIEQIKDNTPGFNKTYNYTYDARYRLRTVSGSESRTYTYNAIGNMMSKSYMGDYTYGESVGNAGPHAVTKIVTSAGTRRYTYDNNGNMNKRTYENGDVYNFFYNANNKLESAKLNSTTLLSNVYDGDGTLVQKTDSVGTNTYVGALYEIYARPAGGHGTRKYYTFGGQRIAVSNNGTLSYLHNDHLNSASLTTNTSGNKVTGSDTRYKPFGGTTGGSSMPTDRLYTGQREIASLDLYDYNARYYDPYIGRFIQADTIIPNPGNSQDFNRYSYVLNNPLRYTDPSGHAIEDYGPFEYNASDWTKEELEYIEEVIRNHPFKHTWEHSNGEFTITLIRVDSLGPHKGGEATINIPNDGNYTITIAPKKAKTMQPAMNRLSAGNPSRNFKGVVAHELTHIAMFIEPELLPPPDPSQTSAVGKRYGFDDEPLPTFPGPRAAALEAREFKKRVEYLAISVAAYMYQPGALKEGPPWDRNWNWQAEWIEDNSTFCIKP